MSTEKSQHYALDVSYKDDDTIWCKRYHSIYEFDYNGGTKTLTLYYTEEDYFRHTPNETINNVTSFWGCANTY